MIFNRRSTRMLKYEKAKSKLVEFNIKKENYPSFQLDPNDLTYSTLYVLSLYCEELIDNPASERLPELFDSLVVVSQYYDSTVKTKLRKEYNNLFLLLGSTAYFLSDNFGSSKVLIEQIESWTSNERVPNLLYVTLYFLLTGKLLEVSINGELYSDFLDNLKNHFQNGESAENLFKVLKKMRDETLKSTNTLSVSCIDFLYGVVIKARDSSAWILLPKYSNINSDKWENYLSKPASMKLLWPAQKVIFQSGVLKGKNIVVPLPTGVGKTKSIEIILRSKFMECGLCAAIIIAPLRALCNEIKSDLISAFADEANINQFTDTMQEDFDLELLFDKNSVLICTPEKFSYILRHTPEFLNSIKLFIFDEAHLFDDASRGVQYELLMSEIARSKKKDAQMVLFSAVLSNANQIGGWLFNDETAVVDYSLVKSTEKSIGFLSSDQTIHYYEKNNMDEESFFVPKSVDCKDLRLKSRETKRRIFPNNNTQDISIYFAKKLCHQGGAAIYAGQARSILPIMRRIVDINDRGYDLSNLLTNGNLSEIEKLSNLFVLNYGNDSELTKASRLGAFPHYANLPNGIKMATEYALREGHIHLVICTSTLAEGINIPIKYLLITTFRNGNMRIQIRELQNLVGRAARSGVHTEGSAIIADTKLYDNRLDQRNGGNYKWNDCMKMFKYENAEACLSAILTLVSDLHLDYKFFYKGDALAGYLIQNYSNPNCFSNLIDILKTGYKVYVSDSDFEKYASNIDQKISQLEHIVESIENYLCYIYNPQQEPKQFFDLVKILLSQTFAYYLADADKRKALDVIFCLIAQKITSTVEPQRSAYFARSLYGINKSNQIMNWVKRNAKNIMNCSTDQILDEILNLFLDLFPKEMIVNSKEDLSYILKLWKTGAPYIDIYHQCGGNVEIDKIDKIEKLCNHTISYSLSFLIGNIIDAIVFSEVDIAKDLLNELSLLQKQIKYGVPNRFQILVCENIFDDRIVVGQLNKSFGDASMNDRDLKKYIRLKYDKILTFLEKYPAYFTYKLCIYAK